MSYRSPYSRFDTEHLTLRDLLAVDRTIAANERTLLGYVRTTLALLAAGGSLLHFVPTIWATATGLLLIAVSAPTIVFGLRHYLDRRHNLRPLMSAVDEEEVDDENFAAGEPAAHETQGEKTA